MQDIPTETIESVYVDREMCQTAAICLAYSIYELDEEAKAVLLTENNLNSDDPKNPLQKEGWVSVAALLNQPGITREEMQKLVLESAQACPFNAILVKDKDGNQVWPQL